MKNILYLKFFLTLKENSFKKYEGFFLKMEIKKVKHGKLDKSNRVCMRSILLYLLLLSCSSGDNRNYYLPPTSTPSYNLENNKIFSSTKKTDTTSFPLEVSTFSFFNLKESVEESATPQGICWENANHPYMAQKHLKTS